VAIGCRCVLAPDELLLGLMWAAEPSEGDLRVVTRVAMQSDPTHDANGDNSMPVAIPPLSSVVAVVGRNSSTWGIVIWCVLGNLLTLRGFWAWATWDAPVGVRSSYRSPVLAVEAWQCAGSGSVPKLPKTIFNLEKKGGSSGFVRGAEHK
jgi:hypothetical protein